MPSLSLDATPLEDALLPRMDASEIHDRILAMRLQEDEDIYMCRDYLRDCYPLLKDCRKPVDPTCRLKMSEWCYQVVDFCKFRRETVYVGMSFLDRFLSNAREGIPVLMDRKEYQLAAMTTLYMAIKIHEPLEMETSLLADLSRGCYSEAEIASMERSILMGLKWRLHGPTPLVFVQHFLALLPDSVHPAVTSALMDYARYQCELAVTDYSLVGAKYSHIALAAILNAIEGMDTSLFSLMQQGVFLRAVEKFSGIMVEDAAYPQACLNAILYQVYRDQQVPEVRQYMMPSHPVNNFHYTQPSYGAGGTGKVQRPYQRNRKASSPVSVALR